MNYLDDVSGLEVLHSVVWHKDLKCPLCATATLCLPFLEFQLPIKFVGGEERHGQFVLGDDYKELLLKLSIFFIA